MLRFFITDQILIQMKKITVLPFENFIALASKNEKLYINYAISLEIIFYGEFKYKIKIGSVINKKVGRISSETRIDSKFSTNAITYAITFQ